MKYFNSAKGSSLAKAVPIDYPKLNQQALPYIDQILDALGLDTKQDGKQLQFINPKRNDRDFGAASINVETGVWKDFADDDEVSGGDVTSFVAWLKNIKQHEAAQLLDQFLVKLEPTTSPIPAAPKRKSDDHLVQVVPVPSDAPVAPFKSQKFGSPSMIWDYTDQAGAVLVKMYRFNLSEGKKTFQPYTLWRNTITSRLQWRNKGLEGARPLYHLQQLIQKPNAPVLIVEGEKAADAAQQLFPNHVVVTTMNGALAPQKTDLLPLVGRDISIWPDHDEVGQKYADKLIELIRKHDSGAVIKIMQPLSSTPSHDQDKNPILVPGFEPEKGFDAADALAMGYTAEHIKLLPEEIFVVDAPQLDNSYTIGDFTVSDMFGVMVTKRDKDGDEYEMPVSSRIDVIAETCNQHGQGFGLLLVIRTPNGTDHEWAMPRELLSGNGEIYRLQLLNFGARIYSNVDLAKFLMIASPQARALCVDSTGWHGNVFVAPSHTYGVTDKRVILQTAESSKVSPITSAGTLQEWQEHIGAKCIGNSRLALAVCIALSGPFLKHLEEENGGFHFRGQSSSGKTKTLTVAGSVWGNKGMVRAWRATGNAIESLAIEHNDCVLILDELAQVSPQDAGDIAYTLGNGQQKARANRFGNVRPIARWRLFFISTGEIGLAEHVAQGGSLIRAGQEIRMLDIPSDGGQGMGVFENLHGIPSPQEFADQLQELSQTYYGTAAEALLTKLTSTSEELEHATTSIRAYQRQFVETNIPADSHGQVFRAAGRFGLVAGVGEYCIELGILPWPKGEALSSASACFQAWLQARGGNVATEEIRALAQVREFLERNGESRFTLMAPRGIEDNIGQRTINRAGFRKGNDNGAFEYWVFPEVYRTELCRGFDPKSVTQVLTNAGHLELASNGRSQVTKRLPGIDVSTRVYVIKSSIFKDESEEGTQEVA